MRNDEDRGDRNVRSHAGSELDQREERGGVKCVAEAPERHDGDWLIVEQAPCSGGGACLALAVVDRRERARRADPDDGSEHYDAEGRIPPAAAKALSRSNAFFVLVLPAGSASL